MSRTVHGLLLIGLLCGAGCHGDPLPADLARAQALEAARRDEDALTAYGDAAARCRAPGQRPHDDCGLLAFRKAQLLERLGRYDAAAQAFLAVREVTVDGRLSGRSLQRAALLYAERLGRNDEALRLCRLVVSRWPDEVAAEDALHLLVELQRDDPGLPAELDRLAHDLGRHETAGFALLYRAERAERDGQLQVAVDRYDDLWRRFPLGPLRDDAAWRAAQLLRKIGHSAEAIRRLEDLERTFRRAILVGHYNKLLLDDAALLLGQIYLMDLHRPDQAISALRGLLKRQPTSLLCDDALLLMAQAAVSRHTPPMAHDVSEACGYLAELRRSYPDGNMVRRATREQQRLGCGTHP